MIIPYILFQAYLSSLREVTVIGLGQTSSGATILTNTSSAGGGGGGLGISRIAEVTTRQLEPLPTQIVIAIAIEPSFIALGPSHVCFE